MPRLQEAEGIHFGWTRKTRSVLGLEFQSLILRYHPLCPGTVLARYNAVNIAFIREKKSYTLKKRLIARGRLLEALSV